MLKEIKKYHFALMVLALLTTYASYTMMKDNEEDQTECKADFTLDKRINLRYSLFHEFKNEPCEHAIWLIKEARRAASEILIHDLKIRTGKGGDYTSWTNSLDKAIEIIKIIGMEDDK